MKGLWVILLVASSLASACAEQPSSEPEPAREDMMGVLDATPTPLDASVSEDVRVPMDVAPTELDLEVDGAVAVDSGPDAMVLDAGSTPDAAAPTFESCFEDIAGPDGSGPNYSQHSPIVGRHCSGTNHQDIEGVQRVVFLGDSVTNGTPNDLHPLCLDNDHFFRVRLANWLADRFDLSKGEPLGWEQWEAYSCLYDGAPGQQTAGAFWNCARWGARVDDFLGKVSTRQFEGQERLDYCRDCCAGGDCGPDGNCVRAAGSLALDERCRTPDKSLFQCVPGGVVEERTLFAFTMGGNDVAAITKMGGEFTRDTPEGRAEIDAGYPTVWAKAREAAQFLEEAVKFMTDPERFPNGSYVVMGGPFEFTDGTGQVSACRPSTIDIPLVGEIDLSSLAIDVAALVGLSEWAEPSEQRAIVSFLLEEYMRITVEHSIDYVWVLEHFCGHGYVATGEMADESNSCYRPDDPSLWFDVSCTHPNDLGHEALFRLFRDVIEE